MTSPSSAWASTRSGGTRACRASRWRRSRRAPRWPTPASAGRTSSSRPAARTRRATPTRPSRCSASPACRSSTSATAARPAASALATAHAMLAAGAAEIALVVGFDKHPPGAFNPLPEDWGLGAWYGETGLMLTTQFFAMKIQRYMAEHGITRVDARQGRREGVRQRRAQPERVAPPAAVGGRGARLQDGQPPADAVHVLLAGRGGGRARAGAGRAREGARARGGRGRIPALGRVPDAPLRVVRGVQPVDPDRRARRRRRPRRRRPRSSRPGSAPRTSTSPSSRTPSPARRSCTSPRPACASTESRRR